MFFYSVDNFNPHLHIPFFTLLAYYLFEAFVANNQSYQTGHPFFADWEIVSNILLSVLFCFCFFLGCSHLYFTVQAGPIIYRLIFSGKHVVWGQLVYSFNEGDLHIEIMVGAFLGFFNNFKEKR